MDCLSWCGFPISLGVLSINNSKIIMLSLKSFTKPSYVPPCPSLITYQGKTQRFAIYIHDQRSRITLCPERTHIWPTVPKRLVRTCFLFISSLLAWQSPFQTKYLHLYLSQFALIWKKKKKQITLYLKSRQHGLVVNYLYVVVKPLAGPKGGGPIRPTNLFLVPELVSKISQKC